MQTVFHFRVRALGRGEEFLYVNNLREFRGRRNIDVIIVVELEEHYLFRLPPFEYGAGIHVGIAVGILRNPYIETAGLEIGEGQGLVSVNHIAAQNVGALLVEQVYDDFPVHICEGGGKLAEFVIVWQFAPDFRTVGIETVYVAESPVWQLENVFITALQGDRGPQHVAPEIETVPFDGKPAGLCILSRSHVGEFHRIEVFVDNGVLEFEYVARLFYGFRLCGEREGAGRVFMDKVTPRALREGAYFVGQRQSQLLDFGAQYSGRIGFVVIHRNLHGIRNRPAAVYPQFERILLQVELADYLILGEVVDGYGIDYCILGHEGDICRAFGSPLPVVEVLLRGSLLEEIDFIFAVTRHAGKCVEHVVAQEFPRGV